MTFDQWLIVLAAIPPTVTAVTALIVAIRNGQKTDAVHLQINSRMDELLKLKGSSEYAKGVKSETDKQEDKANRDFMNPKDP